MNKTVCNFKDYGIMPDEKTPQTEKIQAVLDLAGKTGAKVTVPAGTYITGGLLMHSNTELHLEKGAVLTGSENPDDYRVFEVPDMLTLHTDMQMLMGYFGDGGNKYREEYRRAIISAYGEENITISGEGFDSVIDGADCFDPDGEENLRGPHGIFFTNCRNVRLENYTIRHCGNFHHQLDTCENLTVNHVQALGGHDGFHLHFCRNTDIGNSVIHSGDDCIGGINMENLFVHDCDFNTSCQPFRIGGKHLHFEYCRIWGPGEYPYRASALLDSRHLKPRDQWKTDISSLIEYFTSMYFPQDCSEDIVFENCEMENTGKLIYYVFGKNGEGAHFCGETPFRDLTLRNCRVTGTCRPAVIKAPADTPFNIRFENVTVPENIFDGTEENLVLTRN